MKESKPCPKGRIGPVETPSVRESVAGGSCSTDDDKPMERDKMQKQTDLVPSDSDFTGNLEDWEDRVFQNADHFRVHKFFGRGGHDQIETTDFGEAMRLVVEVGKTPGHRAMVYVVTVSGRSCVIPKERYAHCAEMWVAKRDGPT